MKLTMESTCIKKEDIQFLYSLLPRSCQQIAMHVAVVDDFRLAKPFLQNTSPAFWDRVENGHTAGTFEFTTNRMVLFTENIMHDPFLFIRVAFCFFHEWRHAFQCHHLRDIFDYEWERYMHDTSNDAYEEQWIERDANHFAYQLITMNTECISSHIGKFDWSCSVKHPAPRHPLVKQEKRMKPKWRLFA